MFGTVDKIERVPNNSFEHGNFKCFQCLISLQNLIKSLPRCFAKILLCTIAQILFFARVQNDMMSLYEAVYIDPVTHKAHAKFESIYLGLNT